LAGYLTYRWAVLVVRGDAIGILIECEPYLIPGSLEAEIETTDAAEKTQKHRTSSHTIATSYSE